MTEEAGIFGRKERKNLIREIRVLAEALALIARAKREFEENSDIAHGILQIAVARMDQFVSTYADCDCFCDLLYHVRSENDSMILTMQDGY
ncbi:hypothetical protein [Bosea sp. RAC05]|uniref:hypothetical protein n=1 Tax=Bosea sp. RAC05 TaxID=1842539 RepID=UPI001237279D|nr:hypothetical protein [Bosea sp. RAC05]